MSVQSYIVEAKYLVVAAHNHLELSILILLVFIVGEALSTDHPQAGAPTPIVNILMGILTIGGLALAWRWELAGSIISMVCLIGVIILNLSAGAKPVMLLFTIPAVLYLLCWWLDKPYRSVD